MPLVLSFVFILFNSTAEPAHAYIDPGSGLLVLQILGTTFAGMMFVLRKKIRNLFEFLGKWSHTARPSSNIIEQQIRVTTDYGITADTQHCRAPLGEGANYAICINR